MYTSFLRLCLGTAGKKRVKVERCYWYRRWYCDLKYHTIRLDVYLDYFPRNFLLKPPSRCHQIPHETL